MHSRTYVLHIVAFCGQFVRMLRESPTARRVQRAANTRNIRSPIAQRRMAYDMPNDLTVSADDYAVLDYALGAAWTELTAAIAIAHKRYPEGEHCDRLREWLHKTEEIQARLEKVQTP